jgi:2-phospho-L-lactate guanylyltransferase
VDEIAVVTDDDGARALAREAATVLRDDAGSGQSAAAEIGIRHALANGFERVVLVPGDTPMVDAGELDRLLARVEADRLAIAIVADRHATGTNALVLVPPDALRPSFGPGSRARHAAAAEATGLPHRLEDAPSLAHDVDTPGDLRALLSALEAAPAAAEQTRGAIAELDRSGALRALAGSTEAVPQG